MTVTALPHLRTSERRDFKRCQQRWRWAWRQGLVAKHQKPGALWFGTGIHLALQHRYSKPGLARGRNVLQVWRDFVGDTEAVIYGDNYDNDRDDFYDGAELGEHMLGAYLDEYGMDERWHVISAEQTFEIPIPRPGPRTTEPWEPTLVLYNGTFDLVAMDLEAEARDGVKSLWVWDHKTAKAIMTSHLALDDQAGSYWAVAGDVLTGQGLVEPGMKLDGILYNFLRKSKTDERPRNADGLATNQPTKQHYVDALPGATMKMTKDALESAAESVGVTVLGEVSKTQPKPNFQRETVWRTAKERKTQIERIQYEYLQMDAFKRGLLPIIKTPTKDCSWDCSFFDMCQLQDQRDDWTSYRDATYDRRDPYIDHRKSAADD